MSRASKSLVKRLLYGASKAVYERSPLHLGLPLSAQIGDLYEIASSNFNTTAVVWNPQGRSFASDGSRRASPRRLARASHLAARLSPAGQHLEESSRNLNREQELVDSSTPGAVAPSASSPLPSQVATVVNHSALIVARPIEWGSVVLGYEQANRYTVYDATGTVVAHLLEDLGSIGTAIGRQFLRTRRFFSATVLSPDGDQVIFRLRRPAYLINSTLYIEDGEGNRIGEVQQRWHPWRRRYDLFLGTRQFAAIDGGLLAWEFELKDEQGGTLALIDRNFSGFGKELFTDAGRYAVHFGDSPAEAAQQIATSIKTAYPDRPAPPISSLTRVRTDVEVIPTTTGQSLIVARPLGLPERMVALAAAISVDYDYFSRHSYGGGILSPFAHPPMIPFPVPASGGAAETTEGGNEGANSPDQGTGHGRTEASREEPLDRDLGGDSATSSDWRDNDLRGERPPANEEGSWWGNDGDDDDQDQGGGFGDFMKVFGWDDDDS